MGFKWLSQGFLLTFASLVASCGTVLSQQFPIEFTNAGFDATLHERAKFSRLPWKRFKHVGATDAYSQDFLQDCLENGGTERITIVNVDGRLAAFSAKSVTVDFESEREIKDLGLLADAFNVFFDIRSLYFENARGVPEFTRLLAASHQLDNLHTLAFRDCTLSRSNLVLLGSFRDLVNLHFPDQGPDHFGYLDGLVRLEHISIPTTVTPECFVTLAKLPKLKSIRILQGPFEKNGYLEPQGFNKPISDSVRQAISSLDGRLQSFVSDEFTPIHPSIIRELCKVSSLHTLVVGESITGLRLADVKPLVVHQGLGRRSNDESVLVQGLDLDGDPNDPGLNPQERKQLEQFLSDQRRRINDRKTQP